MKRRIKSLLCEKELILNSGMVFGASFVGALFLFVSNLVLARVFGPEVFGNYKTILGLFIFIPALVDFGASPTLTKYIAEFKAKKEDGKINQLIRFFLKVKGFSLIVLLSLILLFKDVFAHMFLNDASLSYLIVPGLVLSFFILFELSKPVITGFQNFKLFSFSNFLTTASIGIFSIVLGYYYGIYYAILGYSLGYLVGNLPNVWRIIRKKLLHKNGAHLEIMFIFKRYSTPMYFIYLLNMSNILIIPLLCLFFSQTLIGYYGFAWTFYSGVLLIPVALSQVLFPKIAEIHGTKDSHKAKIALQKVFIIYTPIVFLGIIGTLLFSKLIVNIIAPAYLPGVMIFKTLICFCLIFGYIYIYKSYLSAKADIKGVVIWTFIQTISLLVISYFTLILI